MNTTIPIITFCLDDNEQDLLLLKEALEAEGVKDFFMFHDEDEFFDKFNGQVWVAVIDYLLEKSCGLDVAERVLKLNKYAKVIIHSGVESAEETKRALNMGCDFWISKGEENHLQKCAARVKITIEKVAPIAEALRYKEKMHEA